MRIVVAANSQGTDAGLKGAPPYPELLRDRVAPHEVLVFSRSGWSIRDFNTNLDALLELQPDLVVLQVGIVECSKRILSSREKNLLARLRGSRHLTRLLHEHRQRVIRARHLVGLDTRLFTVDEFEFEVGSFVASVERAGLELVLLHIPQFSEAYARRWYPHMREDINTFNAVISAHGGVPWLTDADVAADPWQPETVHFDAAGHQIAARRLAERLISYLEPVPAASTAAQR